MMIKIPFATRRRWRQPQPLEPCELEFEETPIWRQPQPLEPCELEFEEAPIEGGENVSWGRVVQHEEGHVLGVPHEQMRQELADRDVSYNGFRFYPAGNAVQVITGCPD